jgi:type I restriction enzyme S subunit
MTNNAVLTLRASLNEEIFSYLDLILPEYSEQVKAGDFLFLLSQKVSCNNRINAELEAMAKTLYDYWFVQFDFPDTNGNPYKSSGGKMVYNTKLKREIPAGWKDGSLWEIARYFNGLAMQKHRPVGNEYLPVIKIKEMGEGISDSTERARPDIPKEAIIDDGDVLFSWSATLDVKIWSQGKGALNQHIFKVTSDKYPKTFYYFELLRYLAHFKMMAEKRKTTMGHITQDHLKQSRISIPPTELIERAHEMIAPIFKKHLLHEKESHYLIQLRDWLLPMLMTGQVTVA